jgi:hypothetical protein
MRSRSYPPTGLWARPRPLVRSDRTASRTPEAAADLRVAKFTERLLHRCRSTKVADFGDGRLDGPPAPRGLETLDARLEPFPYGSVAQRDLPGVGSTVGSMAHRSGRVAS